MLIHIILIVLGFILLILGADLLVRGSSNIAKRFYIPETLIGLTIVAIGTSLPELMISISSGMKGTTDLIIGNAIGSNLCNLLLVLSVTAILRPIKLERDVKIVHLPVLIISTITIFIMGVGLWGSKKGVIDKADGRILIILYFIYFLYPILIELKNILKAGKTKEENTEKSKNMLFSIIYIIIGAVLLKFGGDIVVDKASELATIFGLSQRLIGLTIIAIGTSLPELVTSIIAITKGDSGLAVGNLVGSCILNSFLVLGTGALITPLVFSDEFIGNLVLLTFVTTYLWISCFIGKKDTIGRYKAGFLLLLYVFYMGRLFR